MKPAATLFILFIVSFIFSCGSARKVPARNAATLPTLPESVIGIPVKIYARPFLDKAGSLAPLQFTSEQWPGYTQTGCDFRYKYRFVRDDLKFSCINNQVSISIAGSYQVAGSKSACFLGKQVAPWITGSCGFNNEPLRRVDVVISSGLRFLPDYTLRSKSEIEKINPVDKCAVTFLNTDITGMVMNTIRASMNAFTASLDRDIAALNILPLVRNAETIIAKPVALKAYGYLSIHPSSVKMGKINLLNDTLYFTLGFSCYPTLSSGSARATRISLPPLADAETPDGFTLYANAGYDYPFVSRLLTKAAGKKIFAIKGEKIMMEEINITPLENNKIELKASFTGSKKGVLYLTGTPLLDTGKQLISVPDINFSLRSGSFVLNAGKTFFNKKILRAIRHLAEININTLYRQNKSTIDQAFTHRFPGNVQTAGSTDQLSIKGMVIKKDSILLQACLKGRIQVSF